MASIEQSSDVFFSRTENYLRYAFAAQQEFFELGINVLARQLDTGRRIAVAQDLTEAFIACSDLMRGTAADLSTTVTHLFDRASDAGSAVVVDTAQSVREVTAAATDAVQKVEEVIERTEQVVRASARRTRKRSSEASAERTIKDSRSGDEPQGIAETSDE